MSCSPTPSPAAPVPAAPTCRVSERSGQLVLAVTLTDSSNPWPRALLETVTAAYPQASPLAHESLIVIATAKEVGRMSPEAKQQLAQSVESAPDAWHPLAFTASGATLGVYIWHPAIDAARILTGVTGPLAHNPVPRLPLATVPGAASASASAATLPDVQSLPTWHAQLADVLTAHAATLAALPRNVRRHVVAASVLPRIALAGASVPGDVVTGVQYAGGLYAECITTCSRPPMVGNVKAHVRAGDAWFKLRKRRCAVVRYACAVALADNRDEAVAEHVSKVLAKVLVEKRVAIDPFECVAQDEGQDELNMLGSVCALVGHEVARQRIARAIREIVMAAEWVEPAVRPPMFAIHALPTMDAPDAGVWHALPQTFEWAVPHLLAGSSSPGTPADIKSFATLGVRLVVSATADALPASWFTPGSIDQVHLPVANNQPPTLAQLDCFIRLVTLTAPHGGILVHCPTGLGATATYLAAYLARFGLAAPPPLCPKCAATISIAREQARASDDFNADADAVEDDTCTDPTCALRMLATLPETIATALMRDVRPDAKPSDPTMDAYSRRIRTRLKTRKPRDDRWPESLPEVPTHVGGAARFSRANLPRVILLVGLPGSGKSHLARTLQSHLPATSIVASDDPGAFLTAIGNLARDPCARLILDACHATPELRLASLAAAFDPPAGEVLVVHVDTPVGVCVERARSRAMHPTLAPARAARVIGGFARQMRVPRFATRKKVGGRHRLRANIEEDEDEDEDDPECKHYGAWIHVQSPAQALALVRQLAGVDALMVKFPRTPHLYAGVASIADDDEIVPDLGRFACGDVAQPEQVWTVEEKVDGANVGVHAVPKVPRAALYSACAGGDEGKAMLADVYGVDDAVTLLVQNRSHFVVSSDSAAAAAAGAPHPQFAGLPSWLHKHKVTLTHLLLPYSSTSTETRYILFGEWTAAKHSVHYATLPDTFLAFDLYDTQHARFVSRARFRAHLARAHAHMRAAMAAAGLPCEPEIAAVRHVWTGPGWPGEQLGTRELADAWVRGMGSAYGAEVPEGIVVRKDVGGWLVERAKYVRGDFIAGDQHWSKNGFVANGVVRTEDSEEV